MFYQSLGGLLVGKIVGLGGRLVEYDDNRFRLSISNKKHLHPLLKSVWDKYEILTGPEKLVKDSKTFWYVYTVRSLSPIKKWDSAELGTFADDCLLFSGDYRSVEVRNGKIRDELTRFVFDNKEKYDIIGDDFVNRCMIKKECIP